MKTKLLVLLLTFVSVQSNAQTFLELNKQFLELFGAEKYSEAIVVGEKSVRQARIEFGTQHVNYAISLDNLATGYYRLGDLQKALVNYKFTITAYTSAGNPEYGSDLALTQNQVGNIYFGQGHYDSAVTYFKQSATYFNQHRDGNIENLLTVSKNIIDCYVELSDYDELFRSCDQLLPLIVEHKGKGDPLYYKVLFYKGMALFELGFAVEAEAVLHEALPLAEKHFTRNHLEYTEVLVMLFRAASGQQKNIEAERYILEAISIYESSLPSEKMSLALVYKGTGNFYSDRGDFSKAQEYFLKSLQLLSDLGLSADDLYHLTSQSLAYSYVQSGHLTEAKKMLDELTRIITASKGKESIEVAELLIVLGGVEVQLNQLSAAENHALEGIRIIKKITKGSHHLLAVAKEALGTVYNRLGNSQQSIATFKEALADETSSAGAETRQAASLYSNIGITYFEMGSYALAEEAYRKSLDIRKKLLGNQHPEYALSLINLGMVNVYQGRYIEADELLAAAAQIFISRNLLHSTNFILLVNNIALMSELQGQHNEAKKLYYDLLDLMEKREEKNTFSLYIVYNNLAKLFFEQEKYDSVLHFAYKAMDILRLENKTDTKEYIKTSNNALLAHKALGDYEKVNAMARELLPLSIRIMGKQSQLVGQIYFNLAVAEQAQGRMDVAARYFAEAADISIKHFKENFYILSEKEKLTWWDNQAFTFSLLPSLLMQAGITEGAFVENLADQQLQLKGFVLDDAATSLRKARSNATPGMKALLDEWQSAKTLLGKTLALPLRERSLSTDSLEQVANTLEKKISQGSATISTMKVVKWQDVQAALKPKEAAIEFVRFPFSRNGKYSDTIAYGAIIIRKDMTSPRFVVLGSEKQFSGYLASDSSGNREVNIHRLYRSNIRKKEPTVFPGDSLYAAIWHPLTRYLEGVNTVSVAPDGILHKVAFHALPVSKDKMLLDLVQLKQYSGIRQLAEATGKNDVKWNSAYLVGNVDFNTTKTNGGGSGGRKSGSWAPLPATMDEVSNIRQIFKSKGVKATVVTGSAATEDDFKKLGDRPVDIIHLATHGFFLRLDNTVTGSEVVLRGEQSLSKAENPLLRSGIILAGANKSWSGEAIPAGAEDGIVNAYEISQVDLSATKLVVLSACETALGDVQGTEGVFGLQRAFKMAGVKNIIVSLWQVPDKETSQLMTLFYTELVKGRTVRDAFHAAQQQMRKKHPPFYWAAFVLVE